MLCKLNVLNRIFSHVKGEIANGESLRIWPRFDIRKRKRAPFLTAYLLLYKVKLVLFVEKVWKEGAINPANNRFDCEVCNCKPNKLRLEKKEKQLLTKVIYGCRNAAYKQTLMHGVKKKLNIYIYIYIFIYIYIKCSRYYTKRKIARP